MLKIMYVTTSGKKLERYKEKERRREYIVYFIYKLYVLYIFN